MSRDTAAANGHCASEQDESSASLAAPGEAVADETANLGDMIARQHGNAVQTALGS